MAKKITGNAYIDQLKDFVWLVGRMKMISKVMYLASPSTIYLQSNVDYQKQVVILNDTLNVSIYDGIVVETARQYPGLNALRKTQCEIYLTDTKRIEFKNNHKDHIGEIVTCTTRETNDIVVAGGIEKSLIDGMYVNEMGVNYLDYIISDETSSTWQTLTDGSFLDNFVLNKAVYTNLQDEANQSYSVLIAIEGFPLMSEKTKDLSYQLLWSDETYFLVLFKEVEENFTLYTIMRFMKDE